MISTTYQPGKILMFNLFMPNNNIFSLLFADLPLLGEKRGGHKLNDLAFRGAAREPNQHTASSHFRLSIKTPFYPFKPNGISNPYITGRLQFRLKGCWVVFFILTEHSIRKRRRP